MKTFLLASAALMALSIGGNAVQAADMPVKYVKPVPVFSWSGCYTGVQVGYKWGESQHTSTGLWNGIPSTNNTAGYDITPWFDVNGAVGGVEAGCQVQWGNWVWGVEVDGSWSAAEGQAAHIIYPGLRFFDNWTSKTSERWLVTARGRLGYAWDKWLWYVTGGGAWTGLDVTVNNIPATIRAFPTQAEIQSQTRGGWVVGYGTEYALTGGWSVKAESLYADFGTFRSHDRVDAIFCNSRTNCSGRDVRLHEWVWRVGMNYRFDVGKGVGKGVGKYPVVAKY